MPFTPAPTIRTDDHKRTFEAPLELAVPSSPHDRRPGEEDVPSVATPSARPTAHCKFWINSRSCQLGDKCELVHASGAELKHARAEWLQERLRLKRLRAKHDDDPLDAHSKSGKQQRAHVFVEWLVAEFGRDFLSSGCGVVDVAGGRGSVSFELWNKRAVPCTLVDPVRSRA